MVAGDCGWLLVPLAVVLALRPAHPALRVCNGCIFSLPSWSQQATDRRTVQSGCTRREVARDVGRQPLVESHCIRRRQHARGLPTKAVTQQSKRTYATSATTQKFPRSQAEYSRGC